MYKSDFNYSLPTELIAQTPLESRDSSRLLCVNLENGAICTHFDARYNAHRAKNDANNAPSLSDVCGDVRDNTHGFKSAQDPAYKFGHSRISELPELLRKGDCLVLNDSRVLPARLLGAREQGGAVEVLLLNETTKPQRSNTCNSTWECLVRPGKKARQGTNLNFGNGELTATVKENMENGNRLIEFHCGGDFIDIIEKLGKMPLPPYIHEELQDAERYQTVYSKVSGSAAAPTAGLHFTHELLGKIKAKGIEICYLTLHVGLGTFRPVKTERIEEHEMHSEAYSISAQTAEIINITKNNGGRVIAVGTTACRTLETVSDDNGRVRPKSGSTGIFIYPGYKFKCVDGLITNFHLPESTLIMLVAALAGRERTLAAYEEAVRLRYRFFSFGDAMLIL